MLGAEFLLQKWDVECFECLPQSHHYYFSQIML